MTKKKESQAKKEVELTEETLEQVSGGFNPQPDPPAIHWKFNQQLSKGAVLPGDKVGVQKI